MPDFYLAAADELRRGVPDAALWSQAHARAVDATEAWSLYLVERARRLERVHVWTSRPLLSRAIDAVLFVSGCILAGAGLLTVGALLYEARHDWSGMFGLGGTGGHGAGWFFLPTLIGASAAGGALACVGARTWWLSRQQPRGRRSRCSRARASA